MNLATQSCRISGALAQAGYPIWVRRRERNSTWDKSIYKEERK